MQTLAYLGEKNELSLATTKRSVNTHLWMSRAVQTRRQRVFVPMETVWLRAGSVPLAFQERFPPPAALEAQGLAVGCCLCACLASRGFYAQLGVLIRS